MVWVACSCASSLSFLESIAATNGSNPPPAGGEIMVLRFLPAQGEESEISLSSAVPLCGRREAAPRLFLLCVARFASSLPPLILRRLLPRFVAGATSPKSEIGEGLGSLPGRTQDESHKLAYCRRKTYPSRSLIPPLTLSRVSRSRNFVFLSPFISRTPKTRKGRREWGNGGKIINEIKPRNGGVSYGRKTN